MTAPPSPVGDDHRTNPADGACHRHFLQSDLWARHKAAFGWHPVRLAFAAGSPGAGLLALSRALPGGVLLTYVPYAPCDQSRGWTGPLAGAPPGAPGPQPDRVWRQIDEIVPLIGAAVRDRFGRDPTLIRFDLPQSGGGQAFRFPAGRLPGAGAALVRAPVEVQPSSTVLIDLRLDLESLLAGMHKKNRYNVGLARRKGVRVREAGASELPAWYELYRQTAVRDGITIHSARYYEHLFELAVPEEEPTLHLYLADHEGELLAGIIVVRCDGGATYLYGASSDEKRNLMPNYALQWHAIEESRRAGCLWYDLFGVPPADDRAHPMHGLYRFKTGFGGTIVHRLGAWDALVRPARARVYRAAERVRDLYFHRFRGGAGRTTA